MEKIVSRYAFIAFICGKLKREYSYISRALPVSVVGIAWHVGRKPVFLNNKKLEDINCMTTATHPTKNKRNQDNETDILGKVGNRTIFGPSIVFCFYRNGGFLRLFFVALIILVLFLSD